MKLIPLYKSMLKAAHLICDDEGFIKKVRGDSVEPWFIGGLPAVLPVDEQLKTPPGTTEIFHPLFEHLSRGESKQLAEYRRAVTERLHLSFMTMAAELLTIAASQQMHSQLTPEQSGFLSFVPEADETMLKKFDALWKAMPEGQNQKTFVSMYLKRGGTLQGKVAHRMAVVTFPLYKQLVEDGKKREAEMEARRERQKAQKNAKTAKDDKSKEDKILNETYGVELRQVDRESFIKLIEYMVPGIDEADSYSAISNSNIAPSVDAVMHAVERLASPINDLVERFENKLSETARVLLKVEDAWVDSFVNLAPLQAEIRMIPYQDQAPSPETKKAMEAEARTIVEMPKPTPEVVAAVQANAEARHSPFAPAPEESKTPHGFNLPPKSIPTQAPRAQPPQPQPQQHIPVGYPSPAAAPNMLPPGVQYMQTPQGLVPVMMTPNGPVMVSMPGAPMPPPQAQQQPSGPIPTTPGHGADFHEMMRRIPGLAQAAVGGAGYQVVDPRMMPAAQLADQPTWLTQPYGTQRSIYQQGQPVQGQQQYYYQQPGDPYANKF